MAGEKEVKAQVRLRFWNVKRERMVATRNLQVTVKKGGGLTMKTLEGILSKLDGVDGGEKRNAISTKCAEMDAEVPRLMGVSTAILDNVIFCHQEESNWPLSEPAALKKKFDDIFEASKFTKALDHIKSLRKERMAELKVDGERLNFLKQDRDKADNLKKELDRHRTDLGRKEAESERLTQRHEELTKANADFYQSSTKFTEIFEKAQALSDKKDMYEQNRNNLKKHIKTVMKESEADLRSMMQNFAKDKQDIESKIEEKRAQLDQLESSHRTLRVRHGKEGQRQGELNANRKLRPPSKRYDRNANDREDLIRSQASQFNIAGFNGKLPRERAEEFISILRDKVSRSREECARIENEGKRADGVLQEEINRLRSQQQSSFSLRADRQKQLNAVKTQIRTAELDVESYSMMDSDIKKIEHDIESISNRLVTTAAEIAAAKYEEKLRQLSVDIRQLEAAKEDINAEYLAMQKHAEARANLSAARSNLVKVQTRIEDAVQNHGPKYLEFTGQSLDPANMEDPLIKAQRTCENERDSISREKQMLLERRNRMESDVAITKENIEKLEMEASRTKKELEVFRAESLDFTEKEDLNEVLTVVHEEIAHLEVLLGQGAGFSETSFFEKVRDVAEKEHRCFGCNRHVKKGEEAALKKYLKDMISKLEALQNEEDLKSDLLQFQMVESKVKAFIPRVEIMKLSSQKTIPEDKQKIHGWEAKINAITKEIESIESRENRTGVRAREITNLRSYAAVMNRDVTEADDLRHQITSTERGLEGSGSTKTTEEIQADMARLDKQIKTKNDERMRTMSERDQLSNRQITDESSLSAKRLQLLETKNKQGRKEQAEAKIEEYEKERARLTEEILHLERKSDSYEKPLREAEDKLRANQSKWSRELTEARSQEESFSRSAADIKQISDDMKRYEDANGDELLSECEKAVRDLERQIGKLDGDISELQQEIASLRNDLSSSDQRAQNIDNNILYREAEHQIEQLKEEIEQIDLEEAARAKQQFDTKYQKAERERTETYGKLQQTVGEISQMKEQARRMQRQLDTDYKNVHGEYIDCLVKWKTGDMANRDLEKYAKALDKTLDEHWREVYSGTDIDSIQIVSESDANNTGTRKSYNYRLVMRKGDQSLDMRGRCSAGQKVLASILVRLALADSFAQQCGVLALDEPTTNLDVDNITALAGALAK
ncbi:hypothetical protein QFC19_000050 [Naganishia cerealis]|uniref:Uncharacterized protein n=1 Tax=Naganishia cerealis TaxID=610337 RepID=A0ACC2WQD2_9TREE|nr:hypothetical protein QFC19_000050 [Naganishia cerealis]